jgi:hypothetical protein
MAQHIQKAVISLALAGALSGCGVVAKIDARQEAQQSRAAYKTCLYAHPSNPRECEGLRLAHEADAHAYRAFSAGIRPGSVLTIDEE